jgi:DNA-binding transcriptional regulator YiaG
MEKKDSKPSWDAEKIRALRQHMKLTQTDMADQLGIRQQTVSEWETGEYQPRGATLKMLSIVADRSGFKYGEKGD